MPDTSAPKPTPCILGTERVANKRSPELRDPGLYRTIVGSLIYVMTERPDLCDIHGDKIVTENPKAIQADLITAKNVLRYLKRTQDT